MLLYSIADNPLVMGLLVASLLAMVAADIWGKIKARKPRRKIEDPLPIPDPVPIPYPVPSANVKPPAATWVPAGKIPLPMDWP